LTNHRNPGYFRVVRRIFLVFVAAPVIAGALAAGASAGNAAAGGDRIASAAPRAPRLGPSLPGGLFGVAAVSASNAWAVGGDGSSPLILHWNGRNWQQAPAANRPPGKYGLNAVAALSARDAWAVGARSSGKTLVLHWNGKKWLSVASPLSGALLAGVAVTSATNAWAVGGVGGITGKAVIEHWNGRKWLSVAVPAPAPPTGSAFLNSVAASSATNAWAVGDFSTKNSRGVLIEHWNGKVWRRVAAPNPMGADMLGVTATSATNALAVGDYSNGSIDLTLVEHWDGKAWHRVPSPSPNQGGDLLAVAARSASLAFAVGQTEPNFLDPGKAFLEEWNGHAWRMVMLPAEILGQFAAVAFGSARSAFAVGTNDVPCCSGHTLIEGWNGSAWG
jgi:hypothetical protein